MIIILYRDRVQLKTNKLQ